MLIPVGQSFRPQRAPMGAMNGPAIRPGERGSNLEVDPPRLSLPLCRVPTSSARAVQSDSMAVGSSSSSHSSALTRRARFPGGRGLSSSLETGEAEYRVQLDSVRDHARQPIKEINVSGEALPLTTLTSTSAPCTGAAALA